MNDDRRGVAALLLVVQSGLYLLAAVGLYTYATLTRAAAMLAVPELAAFGGPLLLLLLSLGVIKGWRAARLGVYGWEALIVLGTAFSIVASAGSALTLTVGLTGLALPAAIVFLVSRPSPNASELRKAFLASLLVCTGLVHLALAPEHPALRGAFLLDGAAFLMLAVASTRNTTWWRIPAAGLLLATIVAYLVVVIRAREPVDDLAIATKAIELLALGLVVWPRETRLSWRWLMATGGLVTTIVLSGGVAWAAAVRAGSTPGHPHGHTLDGKVVLAAPSPTDQQRADAARLVDDTRAGIERFTDVRVALADGYVPGTPPNAPSVHYSNPKYAHNGIVLDPTRPQTLVYANTPSGPMLLGAMYMMPKANIPPPDVGGSLAEWHTHSNLCFTLPKFAIDGAASPFGTCPVGSINGPTPAMLHVWTVPNPGGPFGDLSPAYVERLTR
jgi:hypothetical protein